MPDERIGRSCPVCAAENAAPWLEKDALRLVVCEKCGMIYVALLDRSFADGTFYEDEAAPFYLSEDKLRGDFSPARYNREIGLLRRFVKDGLVLDVGCSTGGFLLQLMERFPGEYQGRGMDVPGEATKHAANKGVDIIPGDFLALEAKEAFDAVTFWAVLEHVGAPREFLMQAERVLKPGGVCFVLVPNIRSLAVRIVAARYRYILPQHINYFSLKTLDHLVRSCGFDVIYRTTTHFNPVVIWQDRRSKSGLVSDAERAKLLVKTNALKENRRLAPARLVYSAVERLLGWLELADNAVLVARKKTPNY